MKLALDVLNLGWYSDRNLRQNLKLWKEDKIWGWEENTEPHIASLVAQMVKSPPAVWETQV